MLVAELDGQIIGAGFAFRTGSSPQCRTATLRNVAVLPPHDGPGLERRLIRRIEDGAASLGVTGIVLAGPRGAERQLLACPRGPLRSCLLAGVAQVISGPAGALTGCQLAAPCGQPGPSGES